MRRRLRYVRRLREIALRDLGGLVFELSRAGRERGDLVAAKVAELEQLDREQRALETALEAEHPVDELRISGVGGLCPSCGAIHSSDASFCSQCGTRLANDGAPGDQPTTELETGAGT